MRPLFKHDATVIIKWDLTTDLILPNDLGVISKLNLQSLGIDIHQLECAEIRFRQGGERCYLKNRTHSHSLKKLFQQWQVPPWQRDRIPLLYSNNQLKAIIGFVACESLTLPSPTSGRGDNFIPSPTSGRGDNFIPSPTSERGDNLIPSHK
jgi:tRNA(Ile)-lysidine synthase